MKAAAVTIETKKVDDVIKSIRRHKKYRVYVHTTNVFPFRCRHETSANPPPPTPPTAALLVCPPKLQPAAKQGTHLVRLLDELLGVDDVTERVGVLDQGPAVLLGREVRRRRVSHLVGSVRFGDVTVARRKTMPEGSKHSTAQQSTTISLSDETRRKLGIKQ